MQAPQSATPQPYFVPVSPSSSRRYQRSGIDGSPSNDCSWPLTRTLTTAVLPIFVRERDFISECAGPATSLISQRAPIELPALVEELALENGGVALHFRGHTDTLQT